MTASPSPDPGSAFDAAALPRRLVFFDGVCGFCDRSVSWLLAHDPDGRLRFAPLQGETAAQLRSRYPEEFPEGLETMVLAETEDVRTRFFLRSQSSFRILGSLPGPVRHVALLRWLPRPLMDAAYRAFARIRYRVFGRLDQCRVPGARVRERFLP